MAERDPMTVVNSDSSESAWVPNTHCLALDGVRGFAILVVTIYRICKELDPSGHPLVAAVQRATAPGTRGVDLFFVLSGFLITGILLQSKGKPNYFRNFIVRRALRIFPLYFLSLCIGLWIIPKVFNTQVFDMPRAEQIYLWTYTSNIRMSWLNIWCFGPFDHFWSLAVEEHFYFVWPAIVLMLSVRSLTVTCVGTIVVVAIARTFVAMSPSWTTAVDVLTLFRIDALAMGALLAIALNSSKDHARIRCAAWIVTLVILPILVSIAMAGNRFLGIPTLFARCL